MRKWTIVRDKIGNNHKLLRHQDIAIPYDNIVENNNYYFIQRGDYEIFDLRKSDNVIEEDK